MPESSRMPVIIGVVLVLALLIGGGLWIGRDKKDNKNTNSSNTSQTTNAEDKMDNKNIVEIASSDSQFSTLVTAIKTAGLVDTLSGTGPFTVFAPTNAAFDKLPAGTLDALLKDPEKLKRILTYHVVSGNVKAADVVKLTSAKTVNGQDVKIMVSGDKVMVNDANVTKTDIAASNGTIHVIDTVLLPQ